jgi:hypothetical protein
MSGLGPINKKVSTILAFHFVLFFLIPYIPHTILLLTDLILVRLVLLAILISSAYISPLVAVSTFVLLSLVFVERNKVKMRRLERAMSQSTPESPAIESIETPETAPVQPAFDEPSVRSHPFMPQPDSGDNSFAPVAESLNQKIPLPTEGSNDGSKKAINQLFRYIDPTPAQLPP